MGGNTHEFQNTAPEIQFTFSDHGGGKIRVPVRNLQQEVEALPLEDDYVRLAIPGLIKDDVSCSREVCLDWEKGHVKFCHLNQGNFLSFTGATSAEEITAREGL